MELIPVAVLQNRMMHASTNGITYLRRSRESLNAAAEEAFCAESDVCSISSNSSVACSLLRDRSNAWKADSFFPLLKSQRGDSATNRLPATNKIPGGIDIQKMR